MKVKVREKANKIGKVIYKTANFTIKMSFYILKIGLVGIQLTLIILPLL